MASNFLSTLSLLSCLLLFTSPFQTSSVNSVPFPPLSSYKVRVEIYYESIGNADFMSQYVPLMFENELISIVDLHLVPWGDSKITKNGTIVCEGGEDECFFNTIEACAIHMLPEVKQFNFIGCIEKFIFIEKKSEWETCFEIIQVSMTSVKNCYYTELGKQLEKRYAVETAALKPPHTFLPWVTVNGKPVEDLKNTMRFICKAYKGSSLPEICKSL